MEAVFFMARNVLKMTHKEQVTHSYHAVVDFPRGDWPTTNFFLVLPKILKSRKPLIIYVPPLLSTIDGTLNSLRVNLHDERPIKAPSIAIMTVEYEKDTIVHEDAIIDIAQISWPSVSFERKVLMLERRKNPLTLESYFQAPSKVITSKRRKMTSLTRSSRKKLHLKFLPYNIALNKNPLG